MPKKSATTTTYTYTVDEIKHMLATQIGVDVDQIKVQYTLEQRQYKGKFADPRDDNSYQVVTAVEVTVHS